MFPNVAKSAPVSSNNTADSAAEGFGSQ